MLKVLRYREDIPELKAASASFAEHWTEMSQVIFNTPYVLISEVWE
jgi:hypothetical protein